MRKCWVTSVAVLSVLLLVHYPQNSSAEEEECDFQASILMEYMGPIAHCMQKHPKNLICVLQCFSETVGIMKTDGTPNVEKIREVMNKFPEGKLKKTMVKAGHECYQHTIITDVESPTCQGYLKLAMCFGNIIMKACPNFGPFMKDFLEQWNNDHRE